MLPATNSYFLTEEARLQGAEPWIGVTLYRIGPLGQPYDEYEIPQSDIYNSGDMSASLDAEKGLDFSDIVFPEFTFYLMNPDNIYTPGHEDFIFAGDTDYYSRGIRVEIGYRRPGTSIIDKADYPVYEGRIITWGPATLISVGDDAKVEFPGVEVQSRNYLGEALETVIAQPNDTTGQPQPLVYGTIMRETEQLADESPVAPDKSAYFESGAVTGADAFDSVEETDATMAISTEEPYWGNYCAKATVNGDDEVAMGVIALPVNDDITMFTWYMKLTEYPAIPANNNLTFMRIFDQAGTERYRLMVKDSAYTVKLGFYESAILGWLYRDCDWYLNTLEDSWTRVSVVIDSVGPTEYIKVYVDGNEVLNWEKSTATGNNKTLKIGLTTGGTVENWTAYFDSVEMYDAGGVFKNMYQVDGGGAYTSIDKIFVDGATVTYSPPAKKRSRRQYNKKHWIRRRYGKSGRRPSEDILTKYIAYGAVDFSVEVGSEVLLVLTKNTTTHPVDQITALITEIGESHRIDTDSFAAAKAANPDDVIGTWVEDQSCIDAIKEICSNCLYEIIPARGIAKLRAYTGNPGLPIFSLTDGDIIEASVTEDTEEIRNKVRATYGWQERAKGNIVIEADADSIDLYGERLEELNFEWGETIGTDSRPMAEDKTLLLFNRLKGPRRLAEVTGFLNLARLELGDYIRMENSFFPAGEVFEVYAISVDLSAMQVTLSLVRFLGENQ